MSVKKIALLLSCVCCAIACTTPKSEPEQISVKTYCNPVDISYRFCLDKPSRREAADPSVIKFKGTYFLFASKSGGYWHSTDLHTWTFIETSEIPVEEYAPTAIAIGDTVYFLASSNEKSTIYKTANPVSGKWTIAVEVLDKPVWDPAFFMDDNQRLYLFWGCSNVNPLYGVELDYKNAFSFIGTPKEILHPNPAQNGWEVPGDYSTLVSQRPWIEGAWVNKHNDTYYLQYSGPGTEFKSYSNGVYVSKNPLGPYTLALHNPFSYKPEGFAAGAGHGSTFTDEFGNYWNISTSTISIKQMFERRLVLYPSFFDEQGTLYSLTKFGDYPMKVFRERIKGFEDIFAGWMLLSYKKPVSVSSSVDSLPASNMTDEDIRTYWAASSGNAGEYVVMDLKKQSDVYALQINFAEHGTELYGRVKGIKHRFTVEHSSDSVLWEMLVDRSDNATDNTHVYIPLKEKIACRYIRLTNLEVPNGSFAVSDLRMFGTGDGVFADPVVNLQVIRNIENRRSVNLSWKKSNNATGYNISFGVDSAKLYNDYMIYGDTALTINTLNSSMKYYFAVESFNERGITAATKPIRVD
jgi:xylan 1,4-beta-xylosidase